ncbi:MAG: hypothetical protein K9L60_03195 [Methylovulum sp.]|jgi:hypothetical protein|nr:hypothetical protein [Methylovulum sp.]
MMFMLDGQEIIPVKTCGFKLGIAGYIGLVLCGISRHFLAVPWQTTCQDSHIRN